MQAGGKCAPPAQRNKFVAFYLSPFIRVLLTRLVSVEFIFFFFVVHFLDARNVDADHFVLLSNYITW